MPTQPNKAAAANTNKRAHDVDVVDIDDRVPKVAKRPSAAASEQKHEDEDDEGVTDITSIENLYQSAPLVRAASLVSLTLSNIRIKMRGVSEKTPELHPCFLTTLTGIDIARSICLRELFRTKTSYSRQQRSSVIPDQLPPLEFLSHQGMFFVNKKFDNQLFEELKIIGSPINCPCWVVLRDVTKLKHFPDLKSSEMMEKIIWYLAEYMKGELIPDLGKRMQVTVSNTFITLKTAKLVGPFANDVLQMSEAFAKEASPPETPIKINRNSSSSYREKYI